MLKVCGIKTFNHGSYKLWQPEKRSGHHMDGVRKRLPLKLCYPPSQISLVKHRVDGGVKIDVAIDT